MRTQKVNDLKQELERIVQTHLRVSERKDSIISRLEATLEEMEEQYQLTLRSHLQNVDQVVSLHEERFDELSKELEDELRELDEEFQIER